MQLAPAVRRRRTTLCQATTSRQHQRYMKHSIDSALSSDRACARAPQLSISPSLTWMARLRLRLDPVKDGDFCPVGDCPVGVRERDRPGLNTDCRTPPCCSPLRLDMAADEIQCGETESEFGAASGRPATCSQGGDMRGCDQGVTRCQRLVDARLRTALRVTAT
jgi:hypothetical protein